MGSFEVQLPVSRRLLAGAAVIAVVAGGALIGAGGADAQVGGRNGVIVFDYRAVGSGGTQIWSVDPASGTTKNLSGTKVGDDQPAVSPSGRMIVFRHDNAIWTMSLSGGARHGITDDAGSKSHPAWSPDGKRIVFSDNGDLEVASATGTGVHTILSGGDNSEPTWSPDGKAIAFTSYRTGEVPQIYTVAPNGTHVVDVSNDISHTDNNPEWSPDSAHIVFNSDRANDGARQNFQVNRNGTGVVQVSADLPSGSFDPVVSPDGGTLAFTKNVNGSYQISVEPLNGVAGQGVAITNLEGTSVENLSWQPTYTAKVTATPSTVARGGSTSVAVAGFGFGEAVTVSVTDSAGTTTSLGTVHAGATGSVKAKLTMPASVAQGSATLTATGVVTARAAHVALTIT